MNPKSSLCGTVVIILLLSACSCSPGPGSSDADARICDTSAVDVLGDVEENDADVSARRDEGVGTPDVSSLADTGTGTGVDADASQDAGVDSGAAVLDAGADAQCDPADSGGFISFPHPDGVVDPNTVIVNIRADNNRDGVVDLDDPADELNKTTWDQEHGAIFLANIDDDEDRCPKVTGTYNTNEADLEMARCNDAADEVVNGPDDLLDLARLKIAPWPSAWDDVKGAISINEKASPYVHLFVKRCGSFTVFHPQVDRLYPTELRQGVDLAIEGTDIVRDSAVWDGFVDISFTVSAGSFSKTDVVRMREAPLITHHHLDPVRRLFVSDIEGDPVIGDYPGPGILFRGLSDVASELGFPPPYNIATSFDVAANHDLWAQDIFETAYMAMPVSNGKLHTVEVNVRAGPNSKNCRPNVGNIECKLALRGAGRIVFNLFRGKDVAGVQQFDESDSDQALSLNSLGNLETIPPYTFNGVSYPLGRILEGNVPSCHPDRGIIRMFESQRVQPPVYVDTSWLAVGHVDETFTFLKASNARGWVIAIPDPLLARTMLLEQQAAGHGDAQVFVGTALGTLRPPERSIDSLLADVDVQVASNSAASHIADQLAVFKEATGVAEDEVIRLPTLFEPFNGHAVACTVDLVNGISLGDSDFGMANPYGPVIAGGDIFKRYAENEFAKLGIAVHWLDDRFYHAWQGEVHCATNVSREIPTDVRWWESGR